MYQKSCQASSGHSRIAFSSMSMAAPNCCQMGVFQSTYGVPAGPLMCDTSWLFSWQMYSMISPFGIRRALNVTLKGLEYAPGSSIVISFTSVPKSLRV